MTLVRGEWLDLSPDSKNKRHSSELVMQLYYKTNVALCYAPTYLMDINYWGLNGIAELYEHLRRHVGGRSGASI